MDDHPRSYTNTLQYAPGAFVVLVLLSPFFAIEKSKVQNTTTTEKNNRKKEKNDRTRTRDAKKCTQGQLVEEEEDQMRAVCVSQWSP